VFELQVATENSGKLWRALFFVLQLSLITLNILTVLGMMGFDVPSLELHGDIQSLIPYESLSLNLFVALQLTSTIYVGRCGLDRMQYLLIRLLPFLSFFCESGITTNVTSRLMMIYMFLILVLMGHFFAIDWGRAVTSRFEDLLEPLEGETT